MDKTMKKQPLLSVIVPVYKAENTLDACIESILKQEVDGLQVILIVDGSPDRSGIRCDQWAEKDPRVMVLHQPNRGVSAARNTGLDHAQGRYITFVDSDDRLLDGLYARALPAMEKEDLSVYLFGVQFSDGSIPWPLKEACYDDLNGLVPDLEQLVVKTGTLAVLYNKIYRAELLDGIRFDETLKVNEDLKLNLEVFSRPGLGSLRFDPQPGYWYEAAAPGSLSRRMRTDLLEAEAITRPAYAAFLRAVGANEGEQERLLKARHANVCVAQYGVLTGPGKVKFSTRRALFSEILAD
ncbi:MAG: glycosyltransferase, partial [Oscillospiraceae bacterium]|nr:glycosyltransferase [Oscillospiraceae bacterium]